MPQALPHLELLHLLRSLEDGRLHRVQLVLNQVRLRLQPLALLSDTALVARGGGRGKPRRQVSAAHPPTYTQTLPDHGVRVHTSSSSVALQPKKPPCLSTHDT
jgi:hypothetical protein